MSRSGIKKWRSSKQVAWCEFGGILVLLASTLVFLYLYVQKPTLNFYGSHAETILGSHPWKTVSVTDRHGNTVASAPQSLFVVWKYQVQSRKYELYNLKTGKFLGDFGDFMVSADGQRLIIVSQGSRSYGRVMGLKRISPAQVTYELKFPPSPAALKKNPKAAERYIYVKTVPISPSFRLLK